jgi:DHA2 family multidrug resistance protein
MPDLEEASDAESLSDARAVPAYGFPAYWDESSKAAMLPPDANMSSSTGAFAVLLTAPLSEQPEQPGRIVKMPGGALPNPQVAGAQQAGMPASAGDAGYLLLGLGLASWMEFYTYDGVNLVLPDMAGTFAVSQDQASWILTTYISALLFGVPLSIWMAAHVGYLRYIVASAGVFAVASVGCALVPDFQTLLVWRAIQGFAGAGLTMWWRASVYMIMQGPRRSGSLMRISVMLYLATAVALVFCGYVTDHVSWRLIFLPNVVFVAFAVRLLVRHYPRVPQPVDPRAVGMDTIGILLLGLALVSVQIVLSRGNIGDWFGSPQIRLLAWIGMIALILFVAWQLSPRNAAPLLHLRLVRDRNVLASMVLGLFAGVILSGSIYALPEFLRNVYPAPLSATQTGEIMCIYALTAAAIRPLVTKSIARCGQRKAIAFAFAMLVASMFLVARLMTTGTPDTFYAIPLVLYAFCLAPMLSAIAGGTVAKLPAANQLDAVAIYMTVRQFGASVGVTLVTTLLDLRETLHSSRLFEHLQTGGARTQAWLTTAAQDAVERGGYTVSQAQQMALKMLSETAARQAATLAYADAFWFMAAIGVVALCCVPLMSPTSVVKK